MNEEGRFLDIAKIAEYAGDQYEELLYDTLDQKCTEIQKKLNKVVDDNAEKYKLVHENDSSKKIKLYALTSRVKEKSSLVEKIIRNQQFYSLQSKTGQDLLDSLLACNDDIIGLRYLVSLSCDCKSVFTLISDHIGELNKVGISFSNIGNKQETMNNGRPIYRLKGRYEGYPFELQIKSKIDSAWADEEHMLFYKENQFSYTQKSNQIVMGQIGAILEEVDKLMVQIREGQNEYSKDEEKELEFYRRLEDRYVPYVSRILPSSFIFKAYRSSLYNFYNHQSNTKKRLIMNKMEESTPIESFRTFRPDDKLKDHQLWKNYENLKAGSIEYVLFEHIYADWLSGMGAKPEDFYTKRKFQAYLACITGCIAETVLEKMAGGEYKDKLTAFASWFGGIVKYTMENKNLSFRPPLFLFDKERMYMLFVSWVVTEKEIDLVRAEKAAISVTPDKKAAESLNKNYMMPMYALMIQYLLNPADEDVVLEELRKLKEKAEKNQEKDNGAKTPAKILSPEFAAIINEAYEKKGKTSSGKKLKENAVSKLLQML